ncbi:MAG: histidinol-phosphate transaminase [Phycisphaeraceae bacterium]|nr:histidinol-phosphate transaminase [Phycisphaeraceae bacterium]
MSYARDNIARLIAYAPGEQPTAERMVKLNTNENPYPPADAVLKAVGRVSADQLRRYPPPLAPAFRQVAARFHCLEPANVIATNGGDELLRMAFTAFCGVGECGIGQTQPTYSLYEVLANIHDTPITTVPLNEDWSIPDDFAAQLNKAGCRLALVVNPHAPSGHLEPVAKLEAIAGEFRGVLLIDEAYVDFASTSALPLVGRRNVLILRTLSKGYSLAGLRFGYGLGHADLIATLDKVRDSYNTDILAQVAAIAAIENAETARDNATKVIAERQRLTSALIELGFIVPPSETNFLLAQPPDGIEAESLYQSLREKAIFVRYFRQPRLTDKLRITIGTPQQNDALIAALKSLR